MSPFLPLLEIEMSTDTFCGLITREKNTNYNLFVERNSSDDLLHPVSSSHTFDSSISNPLNSPLDATACSFEPSLLECSKFEYIKDM